MRRFRCAFVFFFCLLFLSPLALPGQERYLPISEAELRRSEEISGLLARILTERQEQDKQLKELLDRQAAQIASSKDISTKQAMRIEKLLVYSETVLSALNKAGISLESSKQSFDGYVREVSSTTADQEKRLAAAEASSRMWRTIAIVLAAAVALYIAIRVLLKRFSIH